MAPLQAARLFALLLVFATCVTGTPAPQLAESETAVLSVAERFIFSKKCETKRNTDKGLDEECCSGNFECKHSVCKGSSQCRGFLANFFWCHGRECKPIPGQPDPSPTPTRSPTPSPTPDDEPEDSPEPSPEEDDIVDEVEEAEDDDDARGDDRSSDSDTSPTPTQTPSKSPSPTPVATKLPTPTVTPTATSTPSVTPSESPPPSPEAPSPLPSPPPSSAPSAFNELNCDGMRQRKDIRDLTDVERTRWIRAIRKLMEQPTDGGPSEWETLAKLHFDHGDEAHGGCYFLPWHRIFLLKLENLMRRHEPDATLPYWDWTRDSHDASMSTIWGDQYVGGAQRENQPIPNGPFQGYISRFPSWHTVKRNFWSGSSRNMNLFWSWTDLENVIAMPRWSDFADGIESAHILPHNEIGGDMSMTDTAPNDPVFYLHHGYVDFLYSIRQDRSGPNEFGGTHDFATGTVACSLDMVFGAFGVPARNALHMGCVNYAIPQTGGVNQRTGRTGKAPVTVEEKCSDPAALQNFGMSPERCRHGAEILTRS